MSKIQNPGMRKKRRFEIWVRDGKACWLCGKPVKFLEMSLDHVIPKSKGGAYSRINLRAAHPLCNRRRGDRDPILSAVPMLSTDERIALQKSAEP